MAERTIEKFLARAVRPYEQEQGGALGLPLAWTVCEAVGKIHCFDNPPRRITYSQWLILLYADKFEL